MRPSRADAERRLHELLAAAELPPPDETIHQPDEIWFVWEDTKTVIILEFDGAGDGPQACEGRTHSAS